MSLDKRSRVEGRKTWFETIEWMQLLLEQSLVDYNTKRLHQDRNMKDRMPLKTFRDGIRKQRKEVPKADLVTAI